MPCQPPAHKHSVRKPPTHKPPSHKPHSASGVATLALVGALLVTGCGATQKPESGLSSSAASSSASSTPSPSAMPSSSVQADAALAAQVPALYRDKDAIVVATVPVLPPMTSKDAAGHVVGADADLITAVLAKLDLATVIQPTDSFSSMNLGEIGKYDMGMSATFVVPEDMKWTTWVQYLSSGFRWSVRAGNPTGMPDGDPCGRSVAVPVDTLAAEHVASRSEQCVAHGLPAVNISEALTPSQATAALRNGDVEAMLIDSPAADHAAKESGGQIEVLPEQWDPRPYAITLNHGEAEMANLLSQSLGLLKADGTYAAILERWGIRLIPIGGVGVGV
jgi:polar amino acid transport system substrate-binding protein